MLTFQKTTASKNMFCFETPPASQTDLLYFNLSLNPEPQIQNPEGMFLFLNLQPECFSGPGSQ